MPVNEYDKKWRRKNSSFMIWSFIIFLNFIPFLKMDKKASSKRCRLTGWIGAGVYLALIIVFIILSNLSGMTDEYLEACSAEPKSDDYISYSEAKEKYGDDIYYSETPEYQQYLQDYEEYWEQEDNARIKEEAQNRFNTIGSLREYDLLAVIALFLVLLVLAWKERPLYLKRLAAQKNKETVMSSLREGGSPKAGSGSGNPVKGNPKAGSGSGNPVEGNPKAGSGSGVGEIPVLLDLNTATEEEIAALKGLTIIDAKKAISVRDKNGGFKNKEEFYEAIHARPHIIAGLDDILYVSEIRIRMGEKGPTRRHIDL